MASINYYAELAVAIIRLFLIFFSMLICIEIMEKTSGRLKKAVIYFLVALVPSVFYTIGRILNIESLFSAGKLLSLTFNTLTTAFMLLGLHEISRLVIELGNPKIKNGKKTISGNRKINKEINVRSFIKRG